MNYNILKGFALIILIFIFRPACMGQAELPEVLKQGKLTEQLTYIEERTRIYEYYRAIREDMFQQIKKNTIDSLRAADSRITKLITEKNKLNFEIDSLNIIVAGARAGLDEAISTKNSINVLGMNVNKFAYNSVMWIIVASLAGILAVGFLIFRRNLIVSKHTRTDLEELRTEFEAYRKQSRLAREKMSMDHFNEIRRLRAGSTGHKTQGGKPDPANELTYSGEPENEAVPKRTRQSKSHKSGNKAIQKEFTLVEPGDGSEDSLSEAEGDRNLKIEEDTSPEMKVNNMEFKTEESTSTETKKDNAEIPGEIKTSRKKKSSGRPRREEDQTNTD
ncbi:MAG: hypothetical protein GX876_06450 [Bacteroidales bacterium]|nr:hypothetical protein [Bacteroidales bacterium]